MRARDGVFERVSSRESLAKITFECLLRFARENKAAFAESFQKHATHTHTVHFSSKKNRVEKNTTTSSIFTFLSNLFLKTKTACLLISDAFKSLGP